MMCPWSGHPVSCVAVKGGKVGSTARVRLRWSPTRFDIRSTRSRHLHSGRIRAHLCGLGIVAATQSQEARLAPVCLASREIHSVTGA